MTMHRHQPKHQRRPRAERAICHICGHHGRVGADLVLATSRGRVFPACENQRRCWQGLRQVLAEAS